MNGVKSRRSPTLPRKAPGFIPSKKPRARPKAFVDDPKRVQLELKNYLQTRRLVVERSLNPAVRAESKRLALYIDYLRTITHD